MKVSGVRFQVSENRYQITEDRRWECEKDRLKSIEHGVKI
jgi:hypothetical protein